ncbi:hypothetical protein MHLP_03505 [Candidatus Mycoplasma haematolamae str. Purdue]|uniref:Uncharacterized protein n=1 Tax=Mycoplasma haematolamae (strain Purdue) TaxID=1212765 RepID=I7CG97_MYCHA|nr:hypothetical protein [Candidatus Mycoplasma haematolamae]AFO52281.1 hypothetical protein MHLP_03505 [Candidatus Mycoplasma haematolamae str. Purdue]
MSEGDAGVLYVIDDDSKLHKLEPGKHSKRTQRFLEGRLINGRHRWFGPRKFPFEIPDTTTVDQDVSQNWTKYQEILGKLNHEELKKLSDHINKFSDEQYCEIIDVFSSCNFLKPLLVTQGKKINEDVVFSLDKILDLQKKKSLDEAWKDLPGIIDELVKFQKTEIKLVQGYASKAGVKFAQEAWKETWDPSKKVTPLGMIMRAFRGKEFSKVCTDNQMKDVKEKYFKDECGQKIKDHDKVEVVDVLKSAYDKSGGGFWNSSDWRVATKGKGGWADQTPLSNYSKLSSDGYQDGLVSEQCKHMSDWTNVLFTLGQGYADAEVCKKIFEGVFGRDVSEKRYCFCFLS